MQKTLKLSSLLYKSLSMQGKRFITVGESVPKSKVTVVEYNKGEFKRESKSSDELFKNGRYVLVGFPGKHTYMMLIFI